MGSIFRLAPSTRRTSDNGCIGSREIWQTPVTINRKSAKAMSASVNNGRRSGGGNSSPPGLEQEAEILSGIMPKEMVGIPLPPKTAAMVASMWLTPTTQCARHGAATDWELSRAGHQNDQLHIQVACMTWRTPATSEPGVSLDRLRTAEGKPWTPGQRAYDVQTGRVAQVGLTHEIQSTWPTPTTRDGKDGQFTPNVPTNSLLGREVWNGDEAQTAKRGALNPEFVFWLMGCPEEWVCSVLAATQSWRPSRRRS